MVGLKQESDAESQQSERSFVDELGDLVCPELTFQQVFQTVELELPNSSLGLKIRMDSLVVFCFSAAADWICKLLWYWM